MSQYAAIPRATVQAFVTFTPGSTPYKIAVLSISPAAIRRSEDNEMLNRSATFA